MKYFPVLNVVLPVTMKIEGIDLSGMRANGMMAFIMQEMMQDAGIVCDADRIEKRNSVTVIRGI